MGDAVAEIDGQSIQCERQGRIHMFCSAVIRRESEEQAREVKRSARTVYFGGDVTCIGRE